MIRLFPAAAALVGVLAARTLQAQSPETIRGKVVDDSSHAIAGAVIHVTRPDRVTQSDTTDATGAFSIRFEQGTGDYLVAVSAPGFKAARRRIEREAAETDFVANFSLQRDLALLDTVKVRAQRPVRASNPIQPTQLETGAAEKWLNGISGMIAPTAAGDLNAIAGTMPNVTMTGTGASILGSGAESNLTTLNGMGLSASAIPRAARTETRVTGATFDPTRGGFAGANIDVRLGPGSRTYQRRNGYFTLEPQGFQVADAISRAAGATTEGFRGSLGADGELIRRALTYNVAVDVARNTSDPQTLISADADALLRAGVSPDSVARLIALASPLGLGLSSGGVPSNREHQAISWLGRLDDTRDTMRTRALTSYIGYSRDGALGFSPLTAPSAAGERNERTLGAQWTMGDFVGPGRRILTETRIAASGVKTKVTPYLSEPGATVLVRSTTPEASADVTSLTLGGGSSFATDESRWTAEAANETIWMAGGRKHRFKGLLWARADGERQQGISNALGTFTFNSLLDLTAGKPASFSRTLNQPARDGTVWNSAVALAHQYSPSNFFRLLYGARVEADGFFEKPASNPALESALGVQTGVAPSRLHVSPRLGFSYTYNRDKDNGSGTWQSNTGKFYRTTAGVIRGGIGEFRDLLRPGILADAAAATGLPGATSYLSCVGSAVPAPDWSLFANDASRIPTQCLDGSGVLAEKAPQVSLIDPSYDVPRSWRASLDWNTSYKTLLFHIEGLASYDLSQPGIIDANFAGISRLTLPGEALRPVYVSSASIDPASGSVSAAESRKSTSFGRVSTRVSDLHGYGGQLTFGISPDIFKFNGRGLNLFASAAYTLQWSRRQFRGFDGAAFGDPRVREWAPNSEDARHVSVLTFGMSHKKTGTITLFSRLQSGLPFTPIVQGDVNGDGRGGDRAFIPNPATEKDATTASQLNALIANGSSSAKSCIESNLGRVVGRNACRGPWTESLNIQWRPPFPSKWLGRVTPNVYFQNILAGLDQAFHRNGSLHGWGSTATPDPVLLIPRGFDASANRFRYDVNPRFGDTRGTRTLGREPFRISIDFSVNLSTDFGLQQLRRAVEPVKIDRNWQRRSADSLTSFYLQNTSSIFKLLIDQRDSLFLTRTQVAALKQADSVFSARVRAIYLPLGEFLAAGHGSAGKAELDSAKNTEKIYWTIFWEQPEIAGAIVTPAQRALLPMFARMVQVPMDDRKHSHWDFGYPITLVDKK